jgi:arsenite methyltransferase
MYETGLLRQATGGPLRPGGLDLTARLLEMCSLPADAVILDAGCGSGATLGFLKSAGYRHGLGIDRSGPLLQADGSPVDPPLACAEGSAIPLRSDQVDCILSECSLSAMSSLDASLEEFRRVLRPGGWLAVSDLYARSPAGLPALQALPFSCGLRAVRSIDGWMNLLSAHRFEIQSWEDHSEALKGLSSQLARAHGSLSAFWCQAEPDVDPFDLQIAIHKARLGYCLLVARKGHHG